MKKSILWMLAALLVCGANVLTSCSEDDTSLETDESRLAAKLKGKWMMAEVDGKPVPTDSKQVLTYESPSRFYYSLSISAISNLNIWVHGCEGLMKIKGNELSQVVELPDANIKFNQQFNILSITDKEMRVVANSETYVNGQSYRITRGLDERKVRVTRDYSTDIIGTWEGRHTSGLDTYTDDKLHRWKYKTDGTFVYYSQDGHGNWVASENTMSEYYVDGVLLCTRWKNVGDDTEKRESWEIKSIENGKMEWTALRQKPDGSTYTTTFSMTRVEGSESDVTEALTGQWMTVIESVRYGDHMKLYSLLTLDEDGVATNTTYWIYPDEPASYDERIRRHSIYTVDKEAGTITTDDGYGEPEVTRYVLTDDGLICYSIENDFAYRFHRPTSSELELLNEYNRRIKSDDYVGRWFFVTDDKGVYTYKMLEFTDDGTLNTICYTVDGDHCTRTTKSVTAGEADGDEYGDQVIEIHNKKDFSDTDLYRWKIKENKLYLSDVSGDEDEYDIYYPLTSADLELMSELDKKVK